MKKYLWEIIYMMIYNSASFKVVTNEKNSTEAHELAKKRMEDHNYQDIIGIKFIEEIYG